MVVPASAPTTNNDQALRPLTKVTKDTSLELFPVLTTLLDSCSTITLQASSDRSSTGLTAPLPLTQTQTRHHHQGPTLHLRAHSVVETLLLTRGLRVTRPGTRVTFRISHNRASIRVLPSVPPGHRPRGDDAIFRQLVYQMPHGLMQWKWAILLGTISDP